MTLLLDYIKRKILDKATQLGLPRDKVEQLIYEVELVKQAILEKGMTRIIRELGL